jgi:hypothetical protein
MANKKTFHWKYLDNLRINTDISPEDHLCMDPHQIHHFLCSARKRWKDIKQKSHDLRKQFLSELADKHAAKMRTDKEAALKAILRTEEEEEEILFSRSQPHLPSNPHPRSNHRVSIIGLLFTGNPPCPMLLLPPPNSTQFF